LMAESNQFSPDLVKGHYAKSKAIATGWLLERPLEGTEIIIVHPSGVIGPYDYQLSNMSQLFLDMLMGRLRAYIDGGYNFVDVRDVAIGIVSAANRGIDRRCYLLSGDQISVKELLDTISIHEGIKPVKTRLAYGFMRSMSYFAEAYYRLARQKPLFTHYSIVVLRSNANFSNERAKKELGFETRNILQSIRDSIDFARAEFLVKRGKKYIRKI
ncbi:MAG: epimerase, partial [Candidatus Izemoplasmatales bacterium]